MATFGSVSMMAMTSSENEAMVETPTASPSSPSIRFTEFVMITIQMTVTGMEKTPSDRYLSELNIFGFDRC